MAISINPQCFQQYHMKLRYSPTPKMPIISLANITKLNTTFSYFEKNFFLFNYNSQQARLNTN